MWMVFHSDGGNCMIRNSGVIVSVTMLNAELCVGRTTGSKGLGQISFITEVGKTIRRSSSGYLYIYKGNIEQRNDSLEYANQNDATQAIKGDLVYDVAMTVLPNAPIDPSTGISIPTIAVATDGGVSVITDSGTVVDFNDSLGSTRPVSSVIIRGNDITTFNVYNGTVQQFFDALLSTADSTNDCKYNYTFGGGGGSTENITAILRNTTGINHIIENGKTFKDLYAANPDGLSIVHDGFDRVHSTNSFSIFDSKVAYVTSDYNTGYMHGDIKGAFLSDTTVESLTANTNLATSATDQGTNRLSSHTYDDGDTSWQMVDNAGSSNGYINIGLKGLTIGQSYFISMTWDNNATLDSGYEHRIAHLNGTAGENATDFIHWNKTNGSSETLTGVFIAQSVNDDDLIIYCNAITLNVSNFNVRAVDDEDRSVNNKGLAVYGTITKTAVATGADLVAYSGFSNSNYFEQPYNTDLNFGTGDFSLMNWIYVTAGGDYQVVFDRWSPTGGNARFYWGLQTEEKLYFHHREDSSSNATDIIGLTVLSTGVWHHMAAVRRGKSVEVYLDGKLDNSITSTVRNVTPGSTQPILRIGTNAVTSPSDPMLSKLALLRVSASTPSAEQIKKIYDDEKHLFQENSKATLYGSSDAVTALAFDDDTNLLHVGTSSGRSDLQGLCRINNNTTAVTTAITAQNEFIIEQ